MKIVLDTNRLSDTLLGHPDVVQVVQSVSHIFVPFIVLGELHFGFHYGSRRAENERRLNRFLAKPGVAPLFADVKTTLIYGEFKAQLKRQGTPIPTNDIWIAALTLQHGLSLYTRDDHFKHLNQLSRL